MRSLLLTLAAAAILSAPIAAAATLDAGAGSLAAGFGAVGSCDADGFTYAYTIVSDRVTEVTVGDLADPGCEGGRLWVSLAGSSARLGGGGPLTIATDGDTTANTLTLAVPEQPLATDVEAVHAVVVGP